MTGRTDFEPVFDILQDEHVEFIVIGGQAEAFYGSHRVTYDVDLCHRRTHANLERLARALQRMDVTLRNAPPDLPFRIDAQTLAIGDNFTFMTKFGSLDFLGYVEPIGGYDDLLARAETAEFRHSSVRVIGLEDLIRIKQHIGRDKDRASLRHLLAIQTSREQQLDDVARDKAQSRATLENRFDQAMMSIFQRARSEARYNATRFLQMLHEHGGVETAHILLTAPAVSEGYTALWERKRLDLTVEALVVDHPEYHELFSTQEIQSAKKRLIDYGYRSSN